MSRARELANFADNTAGLETLTVSDITDLSVSASNINSATNQITDSSTDLNVDSNTLVVDKSSNRVGMGITAPNTTLHVEGTANSDGHLVFNQQLTSTSNYDASPESGSLVSLKYNSSGSYAGMGGWSIAKENATDGNLASSMQFHTRPAGGTVTERMRIDSSGNVVIGSNGADQSLTLHGTTSAPSTTLGDAIFDIRGSSSAHLLMGLSNASPWGAWIGTDSTAQPLILQGAGGNVGIGTSSPSNKLTLSVASGDGLRMDVDENNAFRTAIVPVSTSGSHTGYLDFRTVPNAGGSPTSRMVILSESGNVGIGTSSPTQRLDVRNPVNDIGITFHPVSTDTHITSNGYWTGSQWNRINTSYGVSNWWHNTVDDHLHLRMADSGSNPVSFSTIATFEQSGEVLIGTTSPNASKLNVHVGTNTSPYLVGIDLRAGNTGPWLFRISSTTFNYRIYAGGSGPTLDTGSWVNSSDIALKENITDLSNGIEILKTLSPKRFTWKDNGSVSYGFIAQDVENTSISEIVGDTNPSGHLTLDYNSVFTTSVKALQECINKIETLEAKVTALESAS